MGLGWVGGAPAVSSVNGKTGAVVLDGTDLLYSPLYTGTGDPSTNIEEELQWRERKVGTADIVWSELTLAAAAPLSGSTYPITSPVICTVPLGGAPISLTATRDVTVAFPGSLDALGGFRVLLMGDVAGAPLLSGEVIASGIAVLNTNMSGSDLQVESLLGRAVAVADVTLLGVGGIVFEDVVGPGALRTLILQPPAPGSSGLTLDGTLGDILISQSVAQAPGTVPYTAFNMPATATVSSQLFVLNSSMATVLSGDNFLDFDVGSTVPTAVVPTAIIGLRATGCIISGPGSMYPAAGAFDETSIELESSGHLSGPGSRYLGDALFDVTQTAGAPDASLTHVGVAPAVDVAPSDNSGGGGAGPTLVAMALEAVSQRHTLDLTGVQNWFVRYDGAVDDLRGVVNWSAQVLKAGGAAATVQGFLQESIALGAFVTIAETASTPVALINNTPQRMEGQAPVTLLVGNRYRIVMSTTDNAIPTLVRSLRIETVGQP